jgi:hypothetical protein
LTPRIRQYIIDFWTQNKKEEDALQQRAFAIYLEAASSPVDSRRKQKFQEQEGGSECDEVQAIVKQT